MARTKLNPERALLSADWAFTGGVTLDSTTLTIDDVNNRVGIGTANPTATLHIDGIDAGNDIALTVTDSVSGEIFRLNNEGGSAGQLSLLSSGTGVIVLDASAGNAGIGTTAPDGTLHVHTATAGVVTANAAAADLVIESNTGAGLSILVPAGNNDCSIIFGDSDDNAIGRIAYAHNTDALTFNTNSSIAMTIDSSQKVGIGISTPDGNLHIHTSSAGAVTADTNSDELVLENSGGCGIQFLGGTTSELNLTFGDVNDNNIGRFVYQNDTNTFGWVAITAFALSLSDVPLLPTK